MDVPLYNYNRNILAYGIYEWTHYRIISLMDRSFDLKVEGMLFLLFLKTDQSAKNPETDRKNILQTFYALKIIFI